MGSLKVDRQENCLIVRRNWGNALSNLLLMICCFSLFAAIPLAAIFVYHYALVSNALMTGVIYLLGLPFFYNAATYLRRREFLFDRHSNQVLLNSEKLCELSEIVSVKLEHSHVSGGRTPVNNQQLSLKLTDGKNVQIEFGSASGASHHELKRVGIAIAEFLGVNSNIAQDT